MWHARRAISYEEDVLPKKFNIFFPASRTRGKKHKGKGEGEGRTRLCSQKKKMD
jgi:hypothetical protein